MGEIVKKQGKGFIFHVIIPARYILLKIKEVKEPLHFSMLESKLWYNRTLKVANIVEFTKPCDQ